MSAALDIFRAEAGRNYGGVVAKGGEAVVLFDGVAVVAPSTEVQWDKLPTINEGADMDVIDILSPRLIQAINRQIDHVNASAAIQPAESVMFAANDEEQMVVCSRLSRHTDAREHRVDRREPFSVTLARVRKENSKLSTEMAYNRAYAIRNGAGADTATDYEQGEPFGVTLDRVRKEHPGLSTGAAYDQAFAIRNQGTRLVHLPKVDGVGVEAMLMSVPPPRRPKQRNGTSLGPAIRLDKRADDDAAAARIQREHVPEVTPDRSFPAVGKQDPGYADLYASVGKLVRTAGKISPEVAKRITELLADANTSTRRPTVSELLASILEALGGDQ